jgi:hypothetical protein
MKKQQGVVIRGISLFSNYAAIYRHSELLIIWYSDQKTELALAPFVLLTATVTEFEIGITVVKKYMSVP